MTKDGQVSVDKKPPDHIVAMVSIFKGATINLIGITSHLLLVFGYSIFLARVLEPVDLGRFFLGYTILNFLVIVSILGLDFAIWRYVALYVGKEKPERARGVILSAFMIALPSSIVFALAWAGGSSWISGTFFSDDGLTPVFRMFAIALPFMVVARVFNASTQGLRKMQYQVLSKDLGEQVSRFALSAALLVFGITGILLANIASGAISALIAFVFIQKSLPVLGEVEVKYDFREVIGFSLPLVFSTVFSYLLLWLDTMMLAYFRGSAEVGLYGTAARVAILGTLVLTSFNTMFSPVISDLYNRKEMERLKTLFRFVTKWVIIISLPIFLLVVFFADPILGIFGETFTAIASSLVVLAVGQFINTATGPVAGMVLMSGRPRLDLVNNVSSVALNLVLCILLIPSWGIMGAAVANAVTQATINIIRAIEIYFIMNVHGYDRTYLKPVFSAGIAGAIAFSPYIFTHTSRIWAVSALMLLFVALYVMMLAVFGLGDEDRTMVRLIRERLASVRTSPQV